MAEPALLVRGEAMTPGEAAALKAVPPQWWADVLAELVHAHSSGRPGEVHFTLHHDSKGQFRAGDVETRKTRQFGRDAKG